MVPTVILSCILRKSNTEGQIPKEKAKNLRRLGCANGEGFLF